MPGEGYEDDDERSIAGQKDEAQVWAQRCKLYIYRAKANNWVQIGVGKASLVRTQPTSRVEFVFEEEELRIPMAKHLLESASSLQRNAGTDKGWSWTAWDTIQVHDGRAETWFTAKFATAGAASGFKHAFDSLKDNPSAVDIAPPGACPSSPPGINDGAAPGTPQQSLLKLSPEHVIDYGLPGWMSNQQRQRSPGSSPPGSPGPESRMLALANQSQAPSQRAMPTEAWLLYFEKGVVKKGSSIRETSTVYVGVYDSKELAIINAVRAMDVHCDKKLPWRVKSCWDRCEDRRRTVGDKGMIVSVSNADGAFNHTKLRKMRFNPELHASGLPEAEDADLWDVGEVGGYD